VISFSEQSFVAKAQWVESVFNLSLRDEHRCVVDLRSKVIGVEPASEARTRLVIVDALRRLEVNMDLRTRTRTPGHLVERG
jgi:hypothetical protein